MTYSAVCIVYFFFLICSDFMSRMYNIEYLVSSASFYVLWKHVVQHLVFSSLCIIEPKNRLQKMSQKWKHKWEDLEQDYWGLVLAFLAAQDLSWERTLCVNTILMMLKKVLVPLEWTPKLDVVKHFAKDGSGLRLGRGIKGFVDHFLSLQTKHF